MVNTTSGVNSMYRYQYRLDRHIDLFDGVQLFLWFSPDYMHNYTTCDLYLPLTTNYSNNRIYRSHVFLNGSKSCENQDIS